MNLLSINNLAKIGREEPLFTGVTFGLDEGDKAALIGRNGTGKSTLLNTVAGLLVPDEGTVVINKEAGLSFLPQNPLFNPDDTIESHIFKSSSPKLNIIREYDKVCAQMESGATDSLQAKFDELNFKMEEGGLWNYRQQIESVLSMLGINDLSRKMGELSGGMAKKVSLAQVLVEDTKLLLLDEPTNHLDITTIYWLQNYLAQTKRAVLMVTHDRYFLDAVCNNIYEIANGGVKLYKGNYSTYLEKKQTELEVYKNTERRIESVLRVERDWLMRGPCARGTKAKARIQHDMALINREKLKEENGFAFEVAGRRLGGKILELKDICKDFPKGYAAAKKAGLSKNGACKNGAGKDTGAQNAVPVLKDFSFTFNKGQKIGVFGNNGTGKSTLLNIITGELLPDKGSVTVGENTVFAYYKQNPVFADLDMTVLEYAKEAAEVMQMNDGTTLSASQFLDRFGFEGKVQYSPVGTLSGGERKRLFLVRLLLSNPNFLILDEPTNDFDIFTMNILEQFLSGFSGCLLVVSHDRYFMDKVADTLLVLESDGSVSGYVGKCSEYIQYMELKAKEDAEAERARQSSFADSKKGSAAFDGALSSGASQSASPAKKKKLSFKEQKEFEGLEVHIAELEDEQKKLEEDMASGDYEKASAAGNRYKEVEEELERSYSRWEELAAFV
ncbi:MAG: ABC-F family ATP-binding cassette domain-containing protein [Treponema sp.]|nr:ABC-F family ATP-binding cassette domain-containing protein [Treponema sp.]